MTGYEMSGRKGIIKDGSEVRAETQQGKLSGELREPPREFGASVDSLRTCSESSATASGAQRSRQDRR